jgi:hypothetical protein
MSKLRVKFGNASLEAHRDLWTIRLRLPGRRVQRSTHYLLCPACQLDRSRPDLQRPCSCRAQAQAEADAWLAEERAAVESAIRAGTAPASVAPLARRQSSSYASWGAVLDTYLAECSPSLLRTAQINSRAALQLLREACNVTDAQARDLSCCHPTAEQLRTWRRLRQARHSTQLSWSELHQRAALPADHPLALPRLETHTPHPANASINSLVAHVSSIVGGKMRAETLRSLRIPESHPLHARGRTMPTYRGAKSVSGEAKSAAHAHAQTWQQSQPEAWLAYWLLLVTGIRPVEMRAARRNWLVEHAGSYWLVLTQRPDEIHPDTGRAGWLKTSTAAATRALPLDQLPPEVLSTLLARPGLLIAPDWPKTRRRDLTERVMSTELHLYMPESNAPVYDLRKWRLTAAAVAHGLAAAAVQGGHSTTTTAANHYVAPSSAQSVPLGSILAADPILAR